MNTVFGIMGLGIGLLFVWFLIATIRKTGFSWGVLPASVVLSIFATVILYLSINTIFGE